MRREVEDGAETAVLGVPSVVRAGPANGEVAANMRATGVPEGPTREGLRGLARQEPGLRRREEAAGACARGVAVGGVGAGGRSAGRTSVGRGARRDGSESGGCNLRTHWTSPGMGTRRDDFESVGRTPASRSTSLGIGARREGPGRAVAIGAGDGRRDRPARPQVRRSPHRGSGATGPDRGVDREARSAGAGTRRPNERPYRARRRLPAGGCAGRARPRHGRRCRPRRCRRGRRAAALPPAARATVDRARRWLAAR